MKNNNIKKISLIFSIFFFLFFFLNVSLALPTIPVGRTITDLWNGIRNLANWIFSFLAVSSLIGVIIGGYMFVTSGGDSGKVASARQIIIYSLAGVFIGAFALVLVNWVAGINMV